MLFHRDKEIVLWGKREERKDQHKMLLWVLWHCISEKLAFMYLSNIIFPYVYSVIHKRDEGTQDILYNVHIRHLDMGYTSAILVRLSWALVELR